MVCTGVLSGLGKAVQGWAGHHEGHASVCLERQPNQKTLPPLLVPHVFLVLQASRPPPQSPQMSAKRPTHVYAHAPPHLAVMPCASRASQGLLCSEHTSAHAYFSALAPTEKTCAPPFVFSMK